MSEDLPTLAAPMTTILCRTALLVRFPLLDTVSTVLSVLKQESQLVIL